MNLLLATSELHPYSKTGGLADMVGSLGKALAREGHQVGIVSPLYRGIRKRFPALKKFDWWLELPLGDARVEGAVWTLRPEPNLTLYFIEQPGFFDRPGIYNEKQGDYPDNAERFIFLSKAVAHLARYLPSRVEVVHAHDWQTGLVPLLIRHEGGAGDWTNPPATCLTIHNLAYQGVFGGGAYVLTNLPLTWFTADGAAQGGNLNSLKAGLEFADFITTVSPRYAREIMTEEFGCGLDPVLRRRHDRLFGILNGVDYDEWRTDKNPCLAHAYSAEDLAGKARQKAELQLEFGLPVSADTPLFGNVSRLADQKGVDIQLGALEEMLAADMQFVLLGSGGLEFEKAYLDLAARHPKQVGVRIGYDQCLAHRIEAGIDFFLMPSAFEPCGLNQMYSLRYGTVPIVRRTGGLDDSVIDIADSLEEANGIKFGEYSVRALARAVRKALVLYRDPDLLAHYRYNGMRVDFSWDKTGDEYLSVYRQAVEQSLAFA